MSAIESAKSLVAQEPLLLFTQFYRQLVYFIARRELGVQVGRLFALPCSIVSIAGELCYPLISSVCPAHVSDGGRRTR